ncbi:MAG: Gfo/Idh/MocA family protein, partial [Pseudolactococcus laudensis]
RIKYGIMGGASIVPRFVKGLKESRSSLAQAIATRSLEKTQKLATILDIPVVYDSYEELIQDPELDIIYIPLWNKGHFAGAKLAIEHGKHVLLEKPFTLKSSESAELFDLSKEKHVFLMEAQKAVFLPIMQEVKKRLEKGEIGEIEWVDVQQSHPGVEKIPWFDDVTAGGGAFIGSASYPLNVLQYLFGTGFDTANGILTHLPSKSDHKGQLILTKGNILMSSLIATSFQLSSRLIIYGSKGVVTIPDYWKADKAMIETVNKTEQIDRPYQSEFVFEIDHVATCLRSGRITSSIMTSEMTLATVKVIEQMYEGYFN